MSEPLLRVTNLRKLFGEVAAVDDVSFEVAAGGSLAIVGESGSGKTTIARMLVGLERPTSGTITFEGQDRSLPATGQRERRRRAHEIQLVFQDPYTSLDPRQTVEDCLDESLKLYLGSFRNHGAFHEDCTLAIAGRLVDFLKPRWLRIGGYWYPRGGMPIDVFWQTGRPPADLWIPDQGVATYRGRG